MEVMRSGRILSLFRINMDGRKGVSISLNVIIVVESIPPGRN
jgi:hypothetical protein